MNRGRQREPRIQDLATHPRRSVSLRVAARYLDIDVRTLRKYLDSGLLDYVTRGERRKIEITALAAFEERQRTRH